MATCDACGLATDALFLQTEGQAYCQHCAPTHGLLPHSADRHATIVRTQVWSYTPKRGLEKRVLNEPQRTMTLDGELLPYWFLSPVGERNSFAVLYARERPSADLMSEVDKEAKVRFKDEAWMR